jgi:glycosyltransferase involved in cell wall biosynthesis
MKIWFTEIGEPLPIESENVRLYRYGMLTRALAAMGHDVTWWTSNFSHPERKFVRDEDCVEHWQGVTLRVLKGPGYPRNISWQRFAHQAHFARRFRQEAEKAERPDIIISPVPTLDIASAAVKLGKKWGVPVLTDIRDEWPDELVDLAPKPLRPLARLVLTPMYRQMRFICRNVAGIMAISRRQLDYALRFSGRKMGPNDGLFPLGYTAKAIEPAKLEAAAKYWREYGVKEDHFIACLFSSINNRLNLKTVFAAARILEKEFPIQFVLCGTGSGLEEARANAAGIKSVLMPGWVDGPKIAALMRMADTGLAPYAAETRMSLPNKPFEYFSGSLPVVSSCGGELGELLETNDCGKSYDPESVGELTSILRGLNAAPERCEAMGRNARALFERDYAGEITFEKINRHLLAVVDRYAKNGAAQPTGFFSSGLAGEPTQT